MLPISLLGLGVIALCFIIYRSWTDPLKEYPGPWLAKWTEAYRTFYQLKARLPQHTAALHAKYGPVVRIGRNSLSYDCVEAWPEINGVRKIDGQYVTLSKDLDEDLEPLNQNPSLIYSDSKDHSRQRRFFSNAFSTKALELYRPITERHVGRLMTQLKTVLSGDKAKDLPVCDWVRATMLDLVGELCFGRQFGCLDAKGGPTAHPICRTSVPGFKELSLFVAMRRMLPKCLWPFISDRLTVAFTPTLTEGDMFAADQVHLRLDSGPNESGIDFIAHAFGAGKGNQPTPGEIENTFGLLLFAGSETMINTLTTALYHVGTMPEVRDKLYAQIRSSLKKQPLSFGNVDHLPYLRAVIEESMRIMSPVPHTLARVSPPGGVTVCGKHIPNGISIGAAPVAACWSPRNFTDPMKFEPRRWVTGSQGEYAMDLFDADRPFSHGPRGCLGKNLARPTMHFLLARLVEEFDILPQPPTYDWVFTQEAHLTWQKPQSYGFREQPNQTGHELFWRDD